VKTLLALARLIDALTERVGRIVIWLVLVATLISAGNALARYTLGASSNAWLEIQWYLFGAMFLLAAGYTLKHNGHVRIDISTIVSARVGRRGSISSAACCSCCRWRCCCLAGVADVLRGLADRGAFADAGGLLRWPVKLLLPAGFALLALQGWPSHQAPGRALRPPRAAARSAGRGGVMEAALWKHGAADVLGLVPSCCWAIRWRSRSPPMACCSPLSASPLGISTSRCCRRCRARLRHRRQSTLLAIPSSPSWG